MIDSVEEYLERLRDEMEGCDPATIEKALAASEDRLRAALASNPDLQSAISEYGLPGQVAAEYRELEKEAPAAGTPTAGLDAETATQGVSPEPEPAGGREAKPRTYSAFWIVFGSIIAFFSFAFIVGGAGMLIVSGTLTDDDGYFMTDSLDMTTTGSYAIVSEPAEIDLGLARAFDKGLASFRIEVKGSGPSGNVFVGVAREDDVDEYLDNVRHAKITEFRVESSKWDYVTVYGNARPDPPAEQGFWEQSVHGERTQTLDWEPETGTWVFAIMNEDGSPDIDVSARIGVRVPWLFGVGIGLLLGGLAGFATGILLVIFAGVKRR